MTKCKCQGQTLCVWTTPLKKGRLTHFTNLEKRSQSIKDSSDFHSEQYCVQLDKLAAEFSRRFGELDVMEDIAAFVSNPFLAIDTEEVAAKFQKALALPGGVEVEMLDMQNDIELKAR